MLRAACSAGQADACAVIAARLLLGTEGQANEAQAATFFKRELQLRTAACAGGDANQCAKMSARGMPVKAALPLDLPKAAAGFDAATTLAVDVAADGDLSVNGQRLADEGALLAAAQKAVVALPGVRATIRADAVAQHGRVMRALDILKQAGITKIAFGVAPGSPGGVATP